MYQTLFDSNLPIPRDAASAKREVQEAGSYNTKQKENNIFSIIFYRFEVVMTPFLQRYMAYMVSLGINFEQARLVTNGWLFFGKLNN